MSINNNSDTLAHVTELEGYIDQVALGALFEEQANKMPDKIALVLGDTATTYRELQRRSDQIAFLLRARGVAADSIIGIMVDRSIEMVVGMLGVLKAGGAYLPIDGDYPQDRINHIVKDSGIGLLLAQKAMGGRVFFDGQVICLDDESLYQQGECAPLCQVGLGDLAYVIYTSGSTGGPKGVMIEHRSVINFIEGMARRLEFSAEDIILAATSISFDISGLEILLPLVKGIKVVLANKHQQKNPKLISGLIINNCVTILQMTPSRMQLLINHNESSFCLKALTKILVGGEPFPKALLDKIKTLSRAEIYNMYGPTETTIWSTVGNLTRSDVVTIGTPIINTSIYILDQNDTPQPVGSIGELCISGCGVARGYLNKSDLTDAKFVCNPFINGERMYKTGDLARWLLDGNLEYLGRADEQVKVRGYRIELGEIESVLMECDQVKGVAVTVVKGADGGNQLCAYFMADAALLVSDLKANLAEKLPSYMIPMHFCQVDDFALTPNGKIDKKALPLPDLQSGDSRADQPLDDNETAETRNIERIILAILDNNANLAIPLEKIGRNDSLADIGLDSITFIKVVVATETRFAIKFNDEDLDSNRFNTVGSLFSYVGDKVHIRTN